MTVTVEICLYDGESALMAQAGGAQRIELCQDRGGGGTTPSYGLIAQVREQLTIAMHVMIRPRSGDFCYSDFELAMMKRDIQAAKSLGANGVVLGVLKPDGSVDVPVMQSLIELSRPLKVTFHRAFDMARNPFEALETLLALGVDYVLTSGQAPSAPLGLETIKKLNERAGGKIGIMAGAGVTLENARHIIEQTGIRQIHAGSACDAPVESRMEFRNPTVSMSGRVNPAEYTYPRTSAARVRELVRVVNQEARP